MRYNNKKAQVVLYSTLHCPHCLHAKKWFKKNHILFLDFNVGKPGKMQKQFLRMGGRSVPLIVIGDQQLNGFNPKQLKSALSKAGLLSST